MCVGSASREISVNSARRRRSARHNSCTYCFSQRCRAEPMSIRPFAIHVEQAILDDLRARLDRTRWPTSAAEDNWTAGTSAAFMHDLAEHWRQHFDWRAQERALNQFAHFRADVDGFGVHFLHERGRGPQAMPLLLTHGWPDSFVRFLKIIPMLTDPKAHGGDPSDAFDVVVPSLPGYAF